MPSCGLHSQWVLLFTWLLYYFFVLNFLCWMFLLLSFLFFCFNFDSLSRIHFFKSCVLHFMFCNNDNSLCCAFWVPNTCTLIPPIICSKLVKMLASSFLSFFSSHFIFLREMDWMVWAFHNVSVFFRCSCCLWFVILCKGEIYMSCSWCLPLCEIQLL